MSRDITVDELREVVGMPCHIVGDATLTVCRPAPIDDATPECVTFYSRGAEDPPERIRASAARVVVCQEGLRESLGDCSGKTLLLVANPRLAFIRVMRTFFAPPRLVGIHPTAVIEDGAVLGSDVYVGPFTYIGRVVIGDGTVIDGHVHIYDNVRIGRNCTIQAGAVIGSDGFGYERNEKGEPEDFPDIGGVTVEDEVCIGSGACIDRGTLAHTTIGRGTKVDNLVHVAHNVTIGPGCLLTGMANLSGGSKLGEGVYVGPSAWIAGVSVGDGAWVTGGAVVTRDVKPGQKVSGNFAIPHDKFIEHMRSIR